MADRALNGINPETKLLALLGHPVTHSGSPAMHNAAFATTGTNARYLAFDVAPGSLPAAVRGLAALGAVGANVTVPHKEAALALADAADNAALRAGAANVLTFREGRIIATNTDGAGFLRAMEEAGCRAADVNVLLLGAGGAARAVAAALLDAGVARLNLLNRSAGRARRLAVDLDDAERLQVVSPEQAGAVVAAADVVVNATSLGLAASDPSPLSDPDWAQARADALAIDLIYVPHQTAFLRQAAKAGVRSVDGRRMLVWQAVLSWQPWFGSLGPAAVMGAALDAWLGDRA